MPTPPASAPWLDALRSYLEARARERRLVSYRQVFTDLGVPGPRQMARLTDALEQTMAEDVAAGRALRAAVVISQVPPFIPRAGFFATAKALGRYQGPDSGAEAQRFHGEALEALFQEVAGNAGNGSGTASPDGNGP